MSETKLPEPWLRGTLTEVSTVQRPVMHALVLAEEDLEVWCGGFSDAELNARPAGRALMAFHLRHIARSLDRLPTYAEGRPLDDPHIGALKTEMGPVAVHKELFSEWASALAHSAKRIRAIDPASLNEARTVGRKQLPTSVAGLLVHAADHTQRHVGQAITTARVVAAHEE
jgi:DinB superfamily